MKKICFVFFLFSASLAFAQNKNAISKIKLIDGSQVNAVIKENHFGKYVKIILPNKEEVAIEYASILSIKHKDYSYFSKYMQTKGFYIEGSTALLFGKETKSDPRLGFALGVTANYQVNSHLSVGIGVDPTVLLVTNESYLMPLYGRLKYNILERRISPVLFLDGGWSFSLTKKDEENFRTISYEGGWYAKPSVGIQINKFTLSVGYQLQKITTTIGSNRNPLWNSIGDTVEERTMKNISVTGSLKF